MAPLLLDTLRREPSVSHDFIRKEPPMRVRRICFALLFLLVATSYPNAPSESKRPFRIASVSSQPSHSLMAVA